MCSNGSNIININVKIMKVILMWKEILMCSNLII